MELLAILIIVFSGVTCSSRMQPGMLDLLLGATGSVSLIAGSTDHPYKFTTLELTEDISPMLSAIRMEHEIEMIDSTACIYVNATCS